MMVKAQNDDNLEKDIRAVEVDMDSATPAIQDKNWTRKGILS